MISRLRATCWCAFLICGFGLSSVRLEAQPDFEQSFRRADANADGAVNLSDSVATFEWFFAGAETPPCLDAVDSNDDGKTDISDGVFTLNALFAGGTPIPSPGPSRCGRDPTPDALGCDFYRPCICGGIAGFPCEEGQFCDLSESFCGGSADPLGTCVPFPDACAEIYDPVCGCDGVTYDNDCFRIQAGAQKDHDGPCARRIQFRTLQRDVTSGASEQTAIIRERSAWETFWSQHGGIFEPAPAIPEVDFDTEMVVVAVRHFTSGGYHLKIEEIVLDQEEVHVFITQVEPSLDCPTTDALTQPYHFVSTERAPGTLVPSVNVVLLCCASAMDAAGAGDCEKLLGHTWDGNGCVALSGCDCEGDDCDDLFPSLEDCEAAYSGCPGT